MISNRFSLCLLVMVFFSTCCALAEAKASPEENDPISNIYNPTFKSAVLSNNGAVDSVYWRKKFYASKGNKGSEAAYLTEIGEKDVSCSFTAPRGVAVGPDGSVYVTEGGGNVVQFTPGGKFIRAFAGHGSGKAQLKYPEAAATGPAGSVYVADMGNDRVQKYNATGQHLTSWGTQGSGKGQFHWIFGISTAPDGSVYTTENYHGGGTKDNQRVQKFTSTGKFLLSWYEFHPSEWFLRDPQGLHVAGDGTVFVVIRAYDQVRRYTAKGKLLNILHAQGKDQINFYQPYDVAVGDGTVFVVENYGDKIHECRYDSGLKDFKSVIQWGKKGKGKGQFDAPRGIAASKYGLLYVCDAYNYRVQIFRVGSVYGVAEDSVTVSGKITGAAAEDYASMLVRIDGQGAGKEKFWGYAAVSENGEYQFAPFPKNGKFTVTLEGVNSSKFKDKTKKIKGKASKDTSLKDYVLEPITGLPSEDYLYVKKVKCKRAAVDPFVDKSVKVRLTGENFADGMTLESDNPQLTFPNESVKVKSSKKAETTMTISAGALQGTYSLKARNPNGEIYIAVGVLKII